MPDKNSLQSIHSLRGLAAVWVCWFHFTRGSESYPTWDLLRASGINGWLGVEIFFVISGFIIPYAMYKSQYSIKSYWEFIYKRVLRLHPPYLASIGLVLILGFLSTLSSIYQGAPFNIDPTRLVLHFFYLIPASNYIWLNDVYWTLAIEFQYYLLLGILYPIVEKNTYSALIIASIFCITSATIISSKIIFHWILLFNMGYLVYWLHIERIRIPAFIISLTIVSICSSLSLGLHQTLAGLFAVIFILYFKNTNKILNFLGNISFSLYLIHIPIGGRIINLGSRFAMSEVSQVMIVLAALGASVITAWIFYNFFEKPAQIFASSIKYK